VGDALLVALGKRLVNLTRSGCTVARFGGDEFVVLSPDTNETEALIVAERLRSALDGCFKIEGHELYVTGSVGVAVAAPGDSPEDVLRNADTAMYRAKEQGRPGYALYDQDMRARSAWRLDVEQDLHLALERGEFRLHYQPIFDVRRGGVTGAEALIRWEHPTRGMVSPADFIPVAEETGLIVPIGEWVLGEACRQAAVWRDQYSHGLVVAVNLAARQLTQVGLADQVSRHLSTSGARPQDLVLEITEHGVLEDFAAASAHLQDVRSLGVKVSVDDFGTGWSSLTYLQRLPIDELKIDRSFISNLGPEGPAVPIVGSLVGMAHGLGLSVVAEGVETSEQLRMLRQLGCDLAQGYLLARPGPAMAMDTVVSDPALIR
jgi:EAL domain-containing protein (putative c-di-GMP-specific phosphodiesterase class I)